MPEETLEQWLEAHYRNTALGRNDRPANRGDDRVKLPPYRVVSVHSTLSQTVDWGVSAFGIPDLWARSKGDGETVGVIDTGIEVDHPDLAGSVVAFRDFTGSPSGTADVNGHGTHCAGIIGARNNQVGVVGVAPQAKLIAAKVLGDDGSGTIGGIVQGIDWAVDRGATLLSMSFGGGRSQPILDAIARAAAKGVYSIVAAGNSGPSEGTVDWPGRDPGNIAVAAVDRDRRIAEFSGRGPQVDIAAPGVEILSTYRGRYAKLSGTSMATPFVAGVVALMLSQRRKAVNGRPPDSIADLRGLLRAGAIDAGPDGPDSAYGWGLINPADLVPLPSPPPPVEPAPPAPPWIPARRMKVIVHGPLELTFVDEGKCDGCLQ